MFGIVRVFFSDLRAKTGAKFVRFIEAWDVIVTGLRFSHKNRCELLPSHLILLLLTNNDMDYNFSYSSGGKGCKNKIISPLSIFSIVLIQMSFNSFQLVTLINRLLITKIPLRQTSHTACIR